MGTRMLQDCVGACPSTEAEKGKNAGESFVQSDWQQARNTPLWTEAMVKALELMMPQGFSEQDFWLYSKLLRHCSPAGLV